MYSLRKSNLLTLSPVACCLLMLAAAVLILYCSQLELTPLEVKAAQIPLGSKLADVKRHLGRRNDFDSDRTGYLRRNEILPIHSKLIANWGAPQRFSVRIWEQDGIRAYFAFDAKGKLASHWTRFLYPPSGPQHALRPHSVYRHARRIFLCFAL